MIGLSLTLHFGNIQVTSCAKNAMNESEIIPNTHTQSQEPIRDHHRPTLHGEIQATRTIMKPPQKTTCLISNRMKCKRCIYVN